ncbi:sporozoite surface protein 2-like, partial [Seriola lalandi dorsalis]|uniref:sporozoite surface protein 2-like n=1 Tax=Seriola lalandi dorsalis TaxID=1841481 RepID=UPI000C6F8627
FGKDNSQQPLFRRRTKSFLEYHGKGWDLDFNWGKKEDKEEKKQQPSPEKEQASPAKERESQKEEKPNSKQTLVEEEEDDPTPTPRQPLLPVVVEAPLSSTSSSSTNSPEWVPDNHGQLQNQAPAQVREELCVQVQASPRSPAKPPRSSQPRVIKVELHPNNENQFLQQYPPSSPRQARAAERNTPTRTRAPPTLPDPETETGLPKVGLRMDLTPDTPSEDEDSSWTTLSQETPSPQTPQETDCLIWKFTKSLFLSKQVTP